MDTDRTGVGFLQADDEPQQYAFAGTAAPQHSQGLAAFHGKADSVQDLLTSEGFIQTFDHNNGHTAIRGFWWFHLGLIDCVHNWLPASTRCLREQQDDEFYKYDIGQDHEQ